MSHTLINRTTFFKKYLLKIILTFIILSVVIFCYKFFVKSSKKALEPAPKLVEVLAVKNENIQQTIRLIGTIRPLHATVLIAKGTGNFDALIPTGEKVHKGALIAKIINPDIENNLELSEATEKIAKTQYDRLLSLHNTGYVSSKEVEEKKQTWIDAQKELSKTKIEFDTMRFYAPFDGIIGAYKIREGTQINQGDPVVTIYDPSTLLVDFDIPCTTITTVKEGQSVRILNKNYSLSHIQRMIDDETHMCPADVAIACENCLIGASTNVDLVVQEKKGVIVVPENALFLRNGKTFAYIVSNGKIVLTPVKTGLRDKSRIEILSGLTLNQLLVIKGQERLYPDMPVQIYKPATVINS
ncbi:MAG: efflux RND transporter periplasmic adaptor subunit [Legionella sp.]|nr:efflux RND transporter periplasmic adaptor subunit [Legionella sp.]